MFRNGLQPGHIIVLLLVVLLIFGASKLPEIAGSIGKSLKVFKKEVKELREDDEPTPTSSYTATGGQPPQTYPAYGQYPGQPHAGGYPPPPAGAQPGQPGAPQPGQAWAPQPGQPEAGAPPAQPPGQQPYPPQQS